MNAAALTIHRAASFASRLFGLLRRARLSVDEALYLTPCNSVHTVFMRYSIDVAFVDGSGRVIAVVDELKPYRAAWCRGARGAVELLAGSAKRHGIAEGRELGTTLSEGLRA